MRLANLLSGATFAFGAALVAAPAAANPNVSTHTQYVEAYIGSADYQDTHSDNGTPYSASEAGGGWGWANAFGQVDGIIGAIVSTYDSSGLVPSFAPMSVVAPTQPDLPARVTSFAETNWEAVIYNDTGSAVDYSFNFHVWGLTIETDGDPTSTAEAGIDIQLNGSSIYNIEASMNGSSLIVDEGFGPMFREYGHRYYANNFTVSVDLGTLASGDSFTLSYAMWAGASNGITGDSGRLANAWIGDPFGFGEGPGVEILGSPSNGGDVSAIPEPATWALMIAGFGLVGFAARRRKDLLTA